MISRSDWLRIKSSCPDLPWCQDEAEHLGPSVMNFLWDQESFIRSWARRWFENFQFIYGNNSIKWSKKYDFAVNTDTLRRNVSMNQKASTNLSRTIHEALTSYLYATIPDWEAESSDQSSLKGKRFAKITEKLLTAYMSRLCMDKEFLVAASMGVCYGQMAGEVGWNPSGGQLMDVPRWKKIKAPVFSDMLANCQMTGGLIEIPTSSLGSDGQPLFEDRWEAVTDGTGKQIIDRIAAGDAYVKMRTPFEYRRQIGTYGMHKTRFVETVDLIDFDEWMETYGTMDGKTKFFQQVEPQLNEGAIRDFALRHFMRLQFTVPPTLNDNGREAGAQFKRSLFKNKVLVVNHYDRPLPGLWDRGRRLVLANGQCTHITAPQYTTNKLDGWHPLVEFQWSNLAPMSIATGPMDSVTAKNRELNIADSLIATAMRRNCGSQQLVKIGSGFDPNQQSGEPGQSHLVNDLEGVRYLHDDQPIAPAVPTIRDSLKSDVYETTGAGDALRGERPPNVSAGYAFQQLDEREQRRLSPARRGFESFAGGLGEKLSSCVRQNVIKLDDRIMGWMIRHGSGEFTPQDVISFLSNPMDYGVDINVKPSSMVISSKATRQANYLELAKGPLQQRLSQDAGVLDEFCKEFDAQSLRDRSACQRDCATRENEVFSDLMRMGPNTEGIKLPVVILEDDDNIHMSYHAEFFVQHKEQIVTNQWLLQTLLLHTEHHRIQLEEKMGQMLQGASQQVPEMEAQARTQAAPQPQAIFHNTMQRQQQNMDAQQQAQGQKPKMAPSAKPGSQPQGAKKPTAPGQAKQPVAGTPSQNTPQGQSAGGQP